MARARSRAPSLAKEADACRAVEFRRYTLQPPCNPCRGDSLAKCALSFRRPSLLLSHPPPPPPPTHDVRTSHALRICVLPLPCYTPLPGGPRCALRSSSGSPSFRVRRSRPMGTAQVARAGATCGCRKASGRFAQDAYFRVITLPHTSLWLQFPGPQVLCSRVGDHTCRLLFNGSGLVTSLLSCFLW